MNREWVARKPSWRALRFCPSIWIEATMKMAINLSKETPVRYIILHSLQCQCVQCIHSPISRMKAKLHTIPLWIQHPRSMSKDFQIAYKCFNKDIKLTANKSDLLSAFLTDEGVPTSSFHKTHRAKQINNHTKMLHITVLPLLSAKPFWNIFKISVSTSKKIIIIISNATWLLHYV